MAWAKESSRAAHEKPVRSLTPRLPYRGGLGADAATRANCDEIQKVKTMTCAPEECGGPGFPDIWKSVVLPRERTTPMTGKRKRYSADFIAKVALENIRGR